MADSYDLILKGGTVVNHDGEGLRDLGIRAGRFAAIGDLSRRFGRRGDRLPRAALAAGRDRHPGPFSRAGSHPQGRPGKRLAVGSDGRRHRRVRDAEHRSADRERGGLGRQGQARPSPHALRLCLFCRRDRATTRGISPSWSGCPAAPASRCSWAHRPARCWLPTMPACARC